MVVATSDSVAGATVLEHSGGLCTTEAYKVWEIVVGDDAVELGVYQWDSSSDWEEVVVELREW